MKRHKNSTLSAFIILLTAAALSGCKKEEPDTLTVTPGFDRKQAHTIMAPLRSASQTFTVNAGTLATIEGAKGTRLTFYPYSFKNSAGDTLTNGTVEISLLEMYSLGDMIANRASTMSGINPLKSGGQIFITARQGGQELFTAGYGISFPQPAASTQAMNIYAGSRDSDLVVIWRPEPLRELAPGTNTDSLVNRFYYQFDSVTEFNFINCDYNIFGNTSSRTDITAFIADKAFDPSNTNVWIAYPRINAIGYMNGYSYTSYNASYESKFTSSNIPLGEKFHVVLISFREGNWYYAELRNQTTTPNHQFALTPITSTKEEILTKLSTLK